MKKMYKDAEKTAMQFAQEIISDIRLQETGGYFLSKPSPALVKAIKGVQLFTIRPSIKRLVEEATGESVAVNIQIENSFGEDEVRCTWDII